MMRRILIIFGYLGLTVLVIGITAGLVAYGQGILYDFKTGRIIHASLMMVQSSPSGIQVTLNGKKLKKKTPYRNSFENGSYTIELSKDGFHPWRKLLAVEWPLVTAVQYAILVPRHPATTTLDSHAQSVAAQSMSKDHRHLAYATSGPDGAVYALDTGGGKAVKAYTPRPAAADKPAEVVTDVTWSDDASHLLIVSQLAGAPLHHVVSANGGDAINLTDQYRFNFTGLAFSASNWRQLYWISPDGLRRLDLDTQTVSAVLADKVSQFQVAGDRVLYVQTTELGRTLWSVDGHGHKQELIQALPESDSYALAYAAYRGVDQLAVVPARTRVATLYSDIYGPNPVAKVITRDVDHALFSPDSHLVTFSSGGAIITYDLERSALLNKLVAYTVPNAHDVRSVSWFDNFHLLINEGERLTWSEFDGANQVDLGELVGPFPAYSGADLRSIIAFGPEGAGVRITQAVIKP